MAKKVVIPVSFQFDDISNQIQQAKNSLKAVNIESNIGQQYSKAFAQIEKEIESIQKKASQGIASQSDINSFARSFQTITGYIERIQTLSRKINFNDINLTSEQVNQYKSLVQQLEKAKSNDLIVSLEAKIQEQQEYINTYIHKVLYIREVRF